MPPFQLETAAVLDAFALISLVVYVLNRPKEGQLKLPIYENEALAGDERDPFDVTKPEDAVDGTPLDENKFWARVSAHPLLIFRVAQLTNYIGTRA